MPLSESWRDQYDRMLRSRDRLAEAVGPSSIGSDEARDRLYHFFQDAYHLKDWIKNSPTNSPRVAKAGAVVEDLFDPDKGAALHMRIAADVCNGIKHLVLTHETKTGDPHTTITRQDVAVTPPTLQLKASIGGAPPSPAKQQQATAEHRWEITSDKAKRDALDLADEVIDAWKDWLNANGLL